MGKPEQILVIEPRNELRFKGPFLERTVTSYIKLTNPSNQKVYFKIKTTAPKRYCVRPNCGYLKPKEISQIAVTLQPFDFDPAEKNKHKFMVQALVAQDNDDEENPDMWKGIDPEQLMESKLKCVFENPVIKTLAFEAVKSEVTTDNGKNKGVGDFVKSSPKVPGETEEKLIKAAQEVNQLREEESALRQENLQLKEDLLQLRNALLVNEATLATKNFSSQNSSESSPPVTSILIAVVMVILGYVLGKMI
ncbi:vesicle-associated membrane protein/synaptobrevin-binding protein [Bombus vosnesenskii]|uniref:Vesicle-associated membrane protein/synaptobrevin-binding protein n=2 Tax=Pyrobombus TaxID=144703 RepID=A0A6J3KHW3_9HYME|nr:vesicle-associated membrane protein/synaptobrevin-binding protein [Bombus vancouverensis nearcticus]XP_033307977.1 vesicle-associated membrane protein/synaptobrevin-binding protein [Bombus bifarius]XP_033352723.1 vesicle-associated membrane protein/synaptobrevin-binding protein [Bombus vosnesenskii]XP_050488290.1 vesicle-associated membrane protein/synaptobrevin-binding protein [Bombus huntii]